MIGGRAIRDRSEDGLLSLSLSAVALFRQEVKRKMLHLIGDDGSSACPSVIWRLYELVKLAGATPEPVINLRECGIIFDSQYFYVQRRLLAESLLLPESVLTRRLDQAMLIGFKAAVDAAHGPSISQEAEKLIESSAHWEARRYATTSDCEKLMQLIGATHSFAISLNRPCAPRDDHISTTLEMPIGALQRYTLPTTIQTYSAGPAARAERPIQRVLCVDGDRLAIFSLPSGGAAPLPLVRIPPRRPIWGGAEGATEVAPSYE
jgi:hypothetical protein